MLLFHAKQIKSRHSDPSKDSESTSAESTNNSVGINNHFKKDTTIKALSGIPPPPQIKLGEKVFLRGSNKNQNDTETGIKHDP